jgi:hypothetical protein
MEAEMSDAEYQDFVYRAIHADDATPDPVAYWTGVGGSRNGSSTGSKDMTR